MLFFWVLFLSQGMEKGTKRLRVQRQRIAQNRARAAGYSATYFLRIRGAIKGDDRYWRTNIDLHWQYSEHEAEINKVLCDFAHWTYNNLRSEYERLSSEEQLVETAEANGYLFDKSGRII